MVMPTFTMRQLLEAGVHFGHHTRRWNPKMAPYIFGVRNNTHIIDLEQTVPLLHRALDAVRQTVAGNGRVLFVGTKRQAAEKIRDAAKRCGQYYVDHRWLGGMLTNWKTISQSIKRLKQMDEQLSGDTSGFTKKELLNLTRERDKLERALGGIRDMGGLPDILFIIDTNKESIAVQEAVKLNIPTVAVIDTNSDPEGVTFPVPGNDDALRAIELYCELVAQSVLEGIQAELMASGADIGESEEPQPEAAAESEGESQETPEAATEEASEPPAAEDTSAEKPAAEEAPIEEAATDTESKGDASEDAKPEEDNVKESAA